MKQQKNVNPYEKKQTRNLHLSRKQWIAIISVLAVAAIIAGIAFAARAGGVDPHAGHNHGNEGTSSNGHYEGDGHDHGTGSTNANQNTAKVKYQVYTNTDKTYRLVIRDQKNAIVFEADKLTRAPIKETVDEKNGIYELGWATGSGATEYECVYYNEQTGQVSKQFHAPLGTDGVRIAYPNEKETSIIVEELFNDKGYRKEHTLEDAHNKNGTIITGGKLQADKKTVLVSYYTNDKGESRHVAINLYA